jgi:hypothetical protein
MGNTGKSKELISIINHLLEDYCKEGDYMSKGLQGEGYHKLSNDINDNLRELYIKSNKEDYFWFDCSLATYKKTFPDRLQKIKDDEDPDKTEEELLLEDYRTFDQLTSKQRVLQLPEGKLGSKDYGPLLNVEVRKTLNEARDKKKNHIQTKFREIGERISKDGDRYYREPLEVIDANTENNSTNNENGIPYKIALLKELGFFSLSAIKAMNKTKQFEVIKELIGGSTRTIKGNVNVLDPDSEEDGTRYTTNNHLEKAKEYLRKQSK